MPRHRVHRAIDRLVLGREYPDVHRWMDEPYKWLGPRHRILRHDPWTVFIRYHGDPPRLLSALLHIMADYGESSLKRRLRGWGRWRR